MTHYSFSMRIELAEVEVEEAAGEGPSGGLQPPIVPSGTASNEGVITYLRQCPTYFAPQEHVSRCGLHSALIPTNVLIYGF